MADSLTYTFYEIFTESVVHFILYTLMPSAILKASRIYMHAVVNNQQCNRQFLFSGTELTICSELYELYAYI